MMRANIASQRKPAIHIIHDVLLMEGPGYAIECKDSAWYGLGYGGMWSGTIGNLRACIAIYNRDLDYCFETLCPISLRRTLLCKFVTGRDAVAY